MAVTHAPTSFVPMTTVFTPPASCSTSWTWAPSVYNSYNPGLLVQHIFSETSGSECWPTGWTQFGRILNPTIQVFSPGWCPSGYTTAIQANGATSTIVTCCLSGYTFSQSVKDAGTWQGCMSTFKSNTPTTVLARPNITNTNQKSIVTSTLYASNINGATMWAQPVTIAYQEKDVSLFTTDSATEAASTVAATPGAGSTISSGVTAATSSAAASSTGDDGGLSTGAKAGIGIGVSLGCIALVSAIVFFVYRARKQQAARRDAAYQLTTQQWPVEVDGQGTQVVEAPAGTYEPNKTLPSSAPTELEGN